MTTLYQLDNKGKIRSWTMEVQDNKYRTVTGIKDGKMITNAWTECEGKNIGRSNETTPQQQAISEAMSLVQSKRDEGYRDTVEDAQLPKQFECMTAKKFDGWTGKPVYSQPKLDGIRCLASKNGLISRGFKEIKSVPHIWDELKIILTAGPEITIDGELYNHDLKENFNQITSLVKKQKPTPDELDDSEHMIQYHVYDIHLANQPNLPFTERYEVLAEISNGLKYLRLVPTVLCNTEAELDELYLDYTADGYEGQMVRIPESLYEQKRSKNLLKRKPLYDDGCIEEELEIIAVHDARGKWANKAKVVDCVLPSGQMCSATIKGNMKRAEQLWLIKDQLIGKMATIKFQNYTPDGIPRFPIAWELDRGAY